MFDVVIVGGGPAGACAGALLARGSGTGHGLSVALLEPRVPPSPEAAARLPPDARVVALSRASERVLRRAGAWQHLPPARVSAYERMHIWHERVASNSDAVLSFDAADVAEPNLGYIVENGLLQGALLQAFSEAGGHLEVASLSSLEFHGAGVTVGTAGGSLSARLVVGADGAPSALRAAAGLTATTAAYGQRAIVATVATAASHQRSAWQRFMSRGTLALLPLSSGESSIVWSADEALALELLAKSDEAFAQALDAASDGVLGRTRLSSARLSFPLNKLSAPRYVLERVALIGDAAHVVHPLAGQGVNLGILDAAALAQQVLDAVATQEDPGALRVLRGYERWRKSEVAAMAASIDAFDRLLAHGRGPLAQLAQRGLPWVNRSAEVRRFFIRRALGVSGELPRSAR